MNKAAIKRFAVWARTKLMADIRTRLSFVGITEDEVKAPLPSSTKEIQYFQGAGTEPVSVKGKNIIAREKLAAKLEQAAEQSGYKTAYESLVESTASAWFNRLIAIRFMEVNGYLSDGIRMLSSVEAGKTDPDIVTAPFESDLEFTDAEKEIILQCKRNSETDKAFRLLFFKRCHQLQKFLPGLFEKEGDATEYLMRLSVVDTDGVIYHLVHDIAEEDFKVEEGGQVEIIGWMYQYYNSELKDDTFAKLKKNIKVTKERIPAATQLFTPDWIVRYMVENSLGRLWLEGHPASKLKAKWKYYLDEAEQEPEVQANLEEIRKERAKLKPEDIRCIDPCMGSGHILSYLFDVLMQIYEEEGYDARDAVEQIVTKNLYGLDIDDRAGQLAYFTVMMKARQYDRRFFSRGLQPNVQAIQESNGIDNYEEATGDPPPKDARHPLGTLEQLLMLFEDAKEYGSLLKIPEKKYERALDWLDDVGDLDYFTDNLFLNEWMQTVKEKVPLLVRQAQWLSQKYDVVVTNPPYMGSSNMGAKLSAFVKKHYPDGKSDLFACFIEKSMELAKSNGFTSLITMESWMFLSSLEGLRKIIISNKTIINMVHMPYLGKGGTSLGINFGTAAVITYMGRVKNYNAQYEYTVYYETDDDGVPFTFPTINERWKTAQQENFVKIPGAPVAYWCSKNAIAKFNFTKMIDVIHPKQGTSTGADDIYVRYWHEIDNKMFSVGQTNIELAVKSYYKYFPLDKGGAFRKWYGNNEKVIKFDQKAYNELLELGNHLPSRNLYFKKGITWSKITSGGMSYRLDEEGFVFSSVGLKGFPQKEDLYYSLSLLNSVVAMYFLDIISPGMSTVSGDIEKIPYTLNEQKKEIIDELTKENINLSTIDWDSFETSWDFQRHPLMQNVDTLQTARAIFYLPQNLGFSMLAGISKYEQTY